MEAYQLTEKVGGDGQQHQGEGKQEAKQKIPMSNIKVGAGERLKLAGAIDQTQGCDCLNGKSGSSRLQE